VIGEAVGHPPDSCRATVILDSTSRALAPAAPSAFRARRKGSFCPFRSSSVIDTGGIAVRRRLPSGMRRLDGIASNGAWNTKTCAPFGVRVTHAHAKKATSSEYHRTAQIIAKDEVAADRVVALRFYT
jgi:hypothetical protein